MSETSITFILATFLHLICFMLLSLLLLEYCTIILIQAYQIVHQVPSVSHHWEYSLSVSISWPVGHTVLVFLVVSLCLACYVVLLMAGLLENFAGTLNNYYYLILREFRNHLTFRKNKI